MTDNVLDDRYSDYVNTPNDVFIGAGIGGYYSSSLLDLLSQTIRDTANVRTRYGAIGDGNYHPLSERFPTLVLAQMRYPHVTSLADSIDWAAIQGAVNENISVYAPKGSYVLSEDIIMSGTRKSITGDTRENTVFLKSDNFKSKTIGALTVSAFIWYHQATDWVEGGSISNISFMCDGEIEGIHLYGVASGMIVRDCFIYRPTIGVNNANNGWGVTYDNVFVVGAVQYSIRLNRFANGNLLLGCKLYGGDFVEAMTHVMIEDACFGVQIIGGFIEQCDVGVRVHKQSQVSISGVDFEVCRLLFVQSIGLYDETETILQFPNPPSHITGCTFVGGPSQGGIVVRGGMMGVYDNNFITNGVDTGSVACLSGLLGGTSYGSGIEVPCISESGNDFTGWTIKTSGKVFNRIAGFNAGSSSMSKLLVGDRSKRLVETQGWNAELQGLTWAEKIFGLEVPSFNVDTPVLSILGLGDRTYATDPEDYTWNHLVSDSGALKITANLQSETAPFPTYGKTRLSAAVTTTAGKVNEYGLVVNSITGAVEPIVNNADKLGSATARWQEVQTVNGIVMQDKTNGNYYRIVCNGGVLSTVLI